MEDEALLAAVEKSLKKKGGVVRWTELSTKFSRKSSSLQNRWLEFAKTEDIFKMHCGAFIHKNITNRFMFGDDDNGGNMLNTDDFVVRVKKRNKRNGEN